MQAKIATSGAMTVAAAVVAVAVLAGGCESSRTNEDVITVTPASSTLTNGNGSVLLTASVNTNAGQKLYLPLTWTVSQPGLGHIEAQAGASAVYVGDGRDGSNTITVRHRGKGEGVAVVYQP